MRGRKGKFECADSGTLFLDEVGDLSPSAQAKLLRAIQDLAIERVGGHGVHGINTRVLAATNRRLGPLVQAGLFRADLFYRLAGIDVQVPPLRERREDILELATYFLERYRQARALELSRPAVDALLTVGGQIPQLVMNAEPLGSLYLSATNVLDLRINKSFRIRGQ